MGDIQQRLWPNTALGPHGAESTSTLPALNATLPPFSSARFLGELQLPPGSAAQLLRLQLSVLMY